MKTSSFALAMFSFITVRAGALELTREERGYSRFVFSHNEDSRCRKTHDPFAIPAFSFRDPGRGSASRLTYPNTSHPLDAGRCVDQSRLRTVLVLTPQGRAAYGFSGNADTLVVGNVLHKGVFYVASVPMDAVRELIFHRVLTDFGPIGVRGSHTQIRVNFSRPAVLTPQFPRNPAVRIPMKELIFSTDSVGADEAARMNPTKAFDGSLLLTHTVSTRESRLFDILKQSDAHTITQFRLRLTLSQAAAYARGYLEFADQQRLSRHYILTKQNCHTSQFRVLDRVLRNDYSPAVRARIARSQTFDPHDALNELAKRELLDDSVVLPPFEEEPESRKYLDSLE